MNAVLALEEAAPAADLAVDLGVSLRLDEVADLLWRAAAVGAATSVLDNHELLGSVDPGSSSGFCGCCDTYTS